MLVPLMHTVLTGALLRPPATSHGLGRRAALQLGSGLCAAALASPVHAATVIDDPAKRFEALKSAGLGAPAK